MGLQHAAGSFMSLYSDINGDTVEAFMISAPTILNTSAGEVVAEVGQYAVCLPNGKPTLLDSDTFNASFTLV